MYRAPYPNELYHWGIKNMKWGQRRYQNPDGTLTAAGKERYRKSGKTSILDVTKNALSEKGFKETYEFSDGSVDMSKKVTDSKGRTKYTLSVNVGSKHDPSLPEIEQSIASVTKNFNVINKIGKEKVAEELKSMEQYGLSGKYTPKDPIITIHPKDCELVYDCKYEGENGYWCMPTIDFDPKTMKFSKYVAIND